MKISSIPRNLIAAAIAALLAVSPNMAGEKESTPFTLKPIPSSAARHAGAPRLRNVNGTSSNWSGYAVYGTATKKGKTTTTPTFSDVKGTWVVPDVVASTSTATYSAAWLGIDGYNDGTVEQIGTDQDWSGGTPQYYAWFEMYPKNSYEIVGFPVHPGDTISAEVAYNGNNMFTLTIVNTTRNVRFSTPQRSGSAQRLSAEWVMEAPWWGGVLPLANFDSISFSDCSATMNGLSAPIGVGQWQIDAITMDATGGTVKAIPSALSSDGADFTVTWSHE